MIRYILVRLLQAIPLLLGIAMVTFVIVHLAPGDPVEIAFKSLPGQIATGKVDQVVDYTGEGQLDMTGVVPIASSPTAFKPPDPILAAP